MSFFYATFMGIYALGFFLNYLREDAIIPLYFVPIFIIIHFVFADILYPVNFL